MFLEDLVDKNLPFVIYKVPGSGQLHIIQQKDTEVRTILDFEADGYYFAPFDMEKHPGVLFPLSESTEQSFLIRLFHEKDPKNEVVLKKENENTRKEHTAKVIQAKHLIQEGVLDKIIISRSIDVPVQKFNPFNAVLKLMSTYDQSYVYFWHHPKVGSWMGASPEILLKTQGNTLHTMALAGTLPVQQNEPVSWQLKELKEQQYVTDYIVEVISKYVQNLNISQPVTVFQGNLAHIKTAITATFQPSELTHLVKVLHPTPAVCGLPPQEAKRYIEKIEAYDRKYYTGFLGKKTKEATGFYVNLRCMSLTDNLIRLYVGGGITLESIPEKEWTETQVKSKVLLSVIQ